MNGAGSLAANPDPNDPEASSLRQFAELYAMARSTRPDRCGRRSRGARRAVLTLPQSARRSRNMPLPSPRNSSRGPHTFEVWKDLEPALRWSLPQLQLRVQCYKPARLTDPVRGARDDSSMFIESQAQ